MKYEGENKKGVRLGQDSKGKKIKQKTEKNQEKIEGGKKGTGNLSAISIFDLGDKSCFEKGSSGTRQTLIKPLR